MGNQYQINLANYNLQKFKESMQSREMIPSRVILKDDNCFTCHTLSKALGGYGGFIVGSAALLDELTANVNVHEGASLAPLPAAARSTTAQRETCSRRDSCIGLGFGGNDRAHHLPG